MADAPLNISTSTGGSALVPSTGIPITPPVTLPSIPNPTPPPPKTLTVITPKPAQKDLSQKQQTTDAVSAAVAQQTQNKLLNTFGQPVNTAGGSPVPQQQPANGQQAPAQNGQTQPAQNGQPAQNANGTPQVQPGQAAGTAQPPAGTTQVTLPNGTPAYFNASTGTMTTQDGVQLTFDKATSAWVDPNTGQPPQAAGQPSGGIPQTGDPTTDYILQTLQSNQQQADIASAQHQQQLNQILNGTFPLTADQQNQVASLSASFDQLKTLQEQANKNFVDATKLLGAREGTMQYQPGSYNKTLADAISAGIGKIAALDNQAATAVATLKQGFTDNDYKIINQSYQDLQDALDKKNSTLTAMQTAVKDQVDIQTAKIQQATDQLALQNNQVTSIAQSVLGDALKADGTLDLDAIQAAADQYGVDPNTLYGAVQKAQQAETTFNQSESKFASDQLQAKAQLGLTQAQTAKTYQDIKTAAQASSGGNIDLTSLPSDSQGKLQSNGFTKFNSGTQGLAISLVTGQLAPSELSKRTTGSSSYNDVLNAAKLYSQATTGKDFNIAQADRNYKFATNVQTQNTLNYLTSLVGTTDGNGNLQGGNLSQLINDSNNLGRTNFPALNDAEQWAKLETGDPAVAGYYATLTEVSDQVAKILQGGGSGSGTSDAKLAQAQALFQKGFSKAQISAVATSLQGLLHNRAQGIVGNNPYLSDYAEQLGIQQDNGAPGQQELKGKGDQSDKDFVNTALTTAGKSYDAAVAAVPKGQIGVIDNRTGAIGSVPPDEYDAGLYTKL